MGETEATSVRDRVLRSLSGPALDAARLAALAEELCFDAEEQDRDFRRGRMLYADERELAILRTSIAIYLDELGTKSFVEQFDSRALRSYLRLLDDFRGLLHDGPDDAITQRFVSFSDNIAIGVPLLVDEEDFGLGRKLHAVASYQVAMATRGRFLRGGVAIGDLYADGSFICGPALVQAVLLEELAANVPRVLLDPTSAALAAEIVAADPTSELATLLLVDVDGKTFVNYLGVALHDDDPDRDRRTRDEVLSRHRAVVLERLRSGESERTLEKFRWVARLHDHVCEELGFPHTIGVHGGFRPLT